MKTYTDKDMVDVVDANDLPIEGMPSVPKTWLGTDLVPAGTKKGKAKVAGTPDGQAPATGTTPPSTRPARAEGEEPAGNASREEWATYAREKGAKDEDLLDDKAEELSRDALKEKFGSKS